MGAWRSSQLAGQYHGWQIRGTATNAERVVVDSMGHRGISGAPESLHLGCNALMQSRIDHRVYVLAHIVAVHNKLRAALHQLILRIPYRVAGLVRRVLATD